jgi:hypothetical protein
MDDTRHMDVIRNVKPARRSLRRLRKKPVQTLSSLIREKKEEKKELWRNACIKSGKSRQALEHSDSEVDHDIVYSNL